MLSPELAKQLRDVGVTYPCAELEVECHYNEYKPENCENCDAAYTLSQLLEEVEKRGAVSHEFIKLIAPPVWEYRTRGGYICEGRTKEDAVARALLEIIKTRREEDQ
jgi:hypothetical protein